ncbi:nuclear transport factor 2 family protein [Aquibium sp. LZ166]|uniref:Nuclear transport factor 2 family protein n=1 Tax=Aquibium pacificus TaxID=3153579 RepID=A0ABV3SM88_9HYPH
MNDRALPAADELAIRNLLARYVHFADAGELDAFASLFTEDGSWTRENTPPASQGGSGLPAETVRGRDGLKKMIEESIIARFDRKFRHQMTDVLIEPGNTPEEADGLCRALITDWRGGAGKIAMCARYRSRFVRTGDGWRFLSVSVHVLPE